MDLFRKLSIALPPGLLAMLELFHASGHHGAVYEALATQLDRWMVVHYLQLLLFPLTAWSVYALAKYLDTGKDLDEFDTWMTRAIGFAMAVYGLGYAAYDSIAGIGSGILVGNSLEMLAIPGAPPDVEIIFQEVVQSYYHSPLATRIVLVAIVAAIFGFLLTAGKIVQRLKDPFRLIPLVFLTGACFGVTKTHAPPWGPLTYGCVFLAVASTLFVSKRSS